MTYFFSVLRALRGDAHARADLFGFQERHEQGRKAGALSVRVADKFVPRPPANRQSLEQCALHARRTKERNGPNFTSMSFRLASSSIFGCSFGCSFGCCCQREGPPPPPASEWAARSRATAAPSERASGRRRSRRGVSAWHESTRNHSPAANPLLRETPSAGKRTDFAVSHSLAYAVAPLMAKRKIGRSSLSALDSQSVSFLWHSRVKIPALSMPISLFLGPPSLLTGTSQRRLPSTSMFSAVRCSVSQVGAIVLRSATFGLVPGQQSRCTRFGLVAPALHRRAAW